MSDSSALELKVGSGCCLSDPTECHALPVILTTNPPCWNIAKIEVGIHRMSAT